MTKEAQHLRDWMERKTYEAIRDSACGDKLCEPKIEAGQVIYGLTGKIVIEEVDGDRAHGKLHLYPWRPNVLDESISFEEDEMK